MPKEETTKEIETSEKPESRGRRSDRECCYIVDPCGCYVDPCCCGPSMMVCR